MLQVMLTQHTLLRRTIAVNFDGSANITIASTDLSNTSAITLLTATQTLTNKTLTSPVINAFTGTGNGTITGNLEVGAHEGNNEISVTRTTSSPSSIKLQAHSNEPKIMFGTNGAGNYGLRFSDSSDNLLMKLTTSGNLSVAGNATITGDLTVNGTTTTISTTNTVVEDSLLELGNGTSGSPANDAGLVIERGDSDNAFIGFDESDDKFKVGTGSFTGSSTGNLTITTGTLVANLEGNVTGNVTGNVSGTAGSATGNAATATALESARTIGGVSFDGTANIDLPGVNSSGNQDTSGNAATATILATC